MNEIKGFALQFHLNSQLRLIMTTKGPSFPHYIKKDAKNVKCVRFNHSIKMFSEVLVQSERISKSIGVYSDENENCIVNFVKNCSVFGISFSMIVMGIVYGATADIGMDELVYVIMELSSFSACAFPYATTIFERKKVAQLTETIRSIVAESKLMAFAPHH